MSVITAESDRHKFRRCLAEAREYLDQIEARGDAHEAEAASAGVWDAIMAAPFYQSPNVHRVARRNGDGTISIELAASLASGDYRKAGA